MSMHCENKSYTARNLAHRGNLQVRSKTSTVGWVDAEHLERITSSIIPNSFYPITLPFFQIPLAGPGVRITAVFACLRRVL